MKRSLLKSVYLVCAAVVLCGCEFVPSFGFDGGDDTSGEQFKSIVAEFGDFDELVYNDNTFILYNHNEENLPEWMYTYTYDVDTDTEHFEYVFFDERGIPEYYNIDNESVYVENVRGNLYDMIVIAEDGTFSLAPNVDAGVNLETFWSESGTTTRASGGESGAVRARKMANYAKGGVSFMQGSFEFWGGAFGMLVGCAMLVPGANVVAGATLMIAGAMSFVTGSMHLAMATDLMHSDGTHTQHLEPAVDALSVASNVVGSIGKSGTQLIAECIVNGTVDENINKLDNRSQEIVAHEEAVEAMMLSLQTANAEVDIATESVTLHGKLSGEIGAGDYVGLYVSNQPSAMYVVSASKANVGADGSFEITCDGLGMGQTYYYKAYYYSAAQDRTYVANTREFVLPGVVTGDYEKMSDGAYRVKLDVVLGEGLSNPKVGICWSTNSNTPTIDDNCSTANVVESGAYGAVIEPSKLPCHYRAFVEVDGKAIYGDVKMIAADERDILIQFYHDTGGDNWIHNDNWCSDKPIEEWYGVEYVYRYCGDYLDDDELIEVIFEFDKPLLSIDLTGNNLQGSGSLAGMSSLAKLNVSLNDLITSLDVSNCPELLLVNIKHEEGIAYLNVSNCNKLFTIHAKGSVNLSRLDAYNCESIKHLCCEDTKITQMITANFEKIPDFHYDARYYYWDEWVDGVGYVRRHEDRGVGWWYLGEPQKGYHEK